MTITETIQLNYQVHFESPFRFGTGLRAGLIHRMVTRDNKGYLYMPGSTLKGVLRERCEQLAALFSLNVIDPHIEDLSEANVSVDIVNRIFGSRFYPSHLYFDDAHLKEQQQAWFDPIDKDSKETRKREFQFWQTEKRTQVSLSRRTRTAEPGHLFTSEYGVQGLSFEGRIYGEIAGFQISDDLPGTYSLMLLLAGIHSLDRDQIGGNKSTGAGYFQLQAVKLTINREPVDIDQILDKLEELEYYQILREEAS